MNSSVRSRVLVPNVEASTKHLRVRLIGANTKTANSKHQTRTMVQLFVSPSGNFSTETSNDARPILISITRLEVFNKLNEHASAENLFGIFVVRCNLSPYLWPLNCEYVCVFGGCDLWVSYTVVNEDIKIKDQPNSKQRDRNGYNKMCKRTSVDGVWCCASTKKDTRFLLTTKIIIIIVVVAHCSACEFSVQCSLAVYGIDTFNSTRAQVHIATAYRNMNYILWQSSCRVEMRRYFVWTRYDTRSCRCIAFCGPATFRVWHSV